MLILVLAGAAACAGRAAPTTLSQRTYTCGEHRIHIGSDRLEVGADALSLGWTDDEGFHYVAWPTGKTTRETVEYLVPADSRLDAVERRYDTKGGTSRVDWRLVDRRFCTASGGYNDALSRFATGKNFDQVASELGLERGEARKLVNTALLTLRNRYYRDR